MTECNGESGPSDNGGVGPGAGLKNFFGLSGLSLVKNNGGAAPPPLGPSPGSTTGTVQELMQ